MRICHVVPSLEDRHGGPSRSVRRLARALADLGHHVELLATEEGAEGETVEAGLRTVRFRRGRPRSLSVAGGLRAHLASRAFDCVHHHALWLRTLHYARRAAESAGVPLVISPRGMLADWSFRHRRWKKRVLELLDLWARIAPVEWLLLLVGIPDEYTVAELADRAARLGAAERIAVFDGTSHPPPYGVASVLLLPSHSENFGLVVADAMAWGVPVVVTDTTPWREVSAADVGWCVPWSEYSDALRDVLGESPGRRSERGRRAREWVAQRFLWEDAARKLAQFYSRLSAQAPSASPVWMTPVDSPTNAGN